MYLDPLPDADFKLNLGIIGAISAAPVEWLLYFFSLTY